VNGYEKTNWGEKGGRRVRILFIGDIVGKPGRDIVRKATMRLIAAEQIDLVVANAENCAGGSGLTPALYRSLVQAGVDAMTLGDHIYRRREIGKVLEVETNIVKPANYPAEAPGRPWTIVEAHNGVRVAIFCLLGRLFMKPIDCPWRAADRVLEQIPRDVRVVLLDFHAEATSEKQLMGRYLDGRVTAVLGTHTHVPTADETVLPAGTAFQCDVGMTGPFDSILGRRVDRIRETTLTYFPTPFDVATGDVRLGSTLVELDPASGKATSIRRMQLTEDDLARLPDPAS